MSKFISLVDEPPKKILIIPKAGYHPDAGVWIC